MNYLHKALLVTSLLFFHIGIKAQQQPQFTQFSDAQILFNPATTGLRSGFSGKLVGRWQWLGFEGAPTTYALAAEYGIPSKQIGTGIVYVHDQAADITNSTIHLLGSYQIRTNSGVLSMGLSGIVNTVSQDLSDIFLLENGDQSFSNNLRESNFNAGVGFHYETSNWWAAFSIPYLLNNEFEENSVQFFESRRHFYIQGGHTYDFGNNIELLTAAQIQATGGTTPNWNVNAVGWYQGQIGLGLGYRNRESVNTILQTRINEGLQVGYAYDIIVNEDLSQLSNGSHEVILTFNPGKSLGSGDTDGDGMKDRKDACPDEAGPESNGGCPLPDLDEDGISDIQDKCPQLKGIASLEGCPDSDGDGIADKDDACPLEAGTIENQGCADTDGDGVIDREDKCPATAGLIEKDGCPDRDRDGIIDEEDRCPDVSGEPLLSGCPDMDEDGLPDIEDSCPDEKGIKENKGCPEASEETKELLQQALTGVQFESGKDVLTQASFEIMDNLVQMMQTNPSYKLRISGYTDSSGDDEKNLELSKKRAMSVMDYLESKGITADRLDANGYGESNPVADNSTVAGRRKNRRVEFEVFY